MEPTGQIYMIKDNDVTGIKKVKNNFISLLLQYLWYVHLFNAS